MKENHHPILCEVENPPTSPLVPGDPTECQQAPVSSTHFPWTLSVFLVID